MTPEEMRNLAKDYFKRHKTEPFGSTWITASTLLLIGSEILERMDRREKKK